MLVCRDILFNMETIERNVALLLSGKDAEEVQDFCDFTLEDQNEAAG